MQKGGDVSLKDAKTNYYVRQVLSILMDGDIVSTGKIASEIGLSEKSTRNKLRLAPFKAGKLVLNVPSSLYGNVEGEAVMVPELYQLCGMDAESIEKQLKKEN